jgi:hypothetical protein
MIEHVLYNAETGQWHRFTDVYMVSGVVAATQPEAFEKLYGHAQPIPPILRAPRRVREEA